MFIDTRKQTTQKISVGGINSFTKRGVRRWTIYQGWFNIEANYFVLGVLLEIVGDCSFKHTSSLTWFVSLDAPEIPAQLNSCLTLTLASSSNETLKENMILIIYFKKIKACNKIVWRRGFFRSLDVLVTNFSRWIELGLIFLKIRFLIIYFAFLLNGYFLGICGTIFWAENFFILCSL